MARYQRRCHPKNTSSPEQEKVYRWLRRQKKPKTLEEVAKGVDKTNKATWPLLDRLRWNKKLVDKTPDGKYFAYEDGEMVEVG